MTVMESRQRNNYAHGAVSRVGGVGAEAHMSYSGVPLAHSLSKKARLSGLWSMLTCSLVKGIVDPFVKTPKRWAKRKALTPLLS